MGPENTFWPGSGSFGIGFGLMASLIVAIGAQNTLLLRQGLRREHVGLLVTVCCLIDIALMSIGIFGLAGAARLHPQALTALVLAGAAFLFAYGLQAARRATHAQALDVNAGPAELLSRRAALLQMLAMSLLNPHVYLDTVVLVGTVGAQQPAAARTAFLAGASSASVLWFCALGYGARWLAPLFAKPLAWRILDAFIALTMWMLAASLLWAWWRASIH